jgi:hypothetical protein
MSTELPGEPFLTADQSVDFLNDELGIPTSKSAFRKETMPSRATGLTPVAYWGKRPLWTPSVLRAWAAARLRLIERGSNTAPGEPFKAGQRSRQCPHELPRRGSHLEPNV